ncbi:hypothetical protein CSA57_09430 [candidate division KSB3 bacterium]|nr:MAG: hypothetical protein CSA57_09430 [candidate division KSB3 bacterium]
MNIPPYTLYVTDRASGITTTYVTFSTKSPKNPGRLPFTEHRAQNSTVILCLRRSWRQEKKQELVLERCQAKQRLNFFGKKAAGDVSQRGCHV